MVNYYHNSKIKLIKTYNLQLATSDNNFDRLKLKPS